MNAAPSSGETLAPAKVLVIDDHPIVRKGLALLINQEDDLHVCGEAQNANEAMDFMARVLPDVALVDISLPGITGIDLIKQIRGRHPRVRVLVLSMLDEDNYAERALRAGARGYIMKQEATDRLISAIRRVLKGDVYLSDDMSTRLLQQLVEGKPESSNSLVARLSDREIEVFRRLGHGMSTRKISEDLNLSVKTIESYRENIKHKLAIRTANELVQRAVQWVQTEEMM